MKKKKCQKKDIFHEKKKKKREIQLLYNNNYNKDLMNIAVYKKKKTKAEQEAFTYNIY